MWDAAALRRQCATLRAVEPGLSLRVEEVIADGQRGVAGVSLDGLRGASRLGQRKTGLPAAAPSDRLRVANGRVVEYSGVLAELVVPEPLMTERVAVPRATKAWVEISRLTLQRGAVFCSQLFGGPLVCAGEAGEVELWSTGVGPGIDPNAGRR